MLRAATMTTRPGHITAIVPASRRRLAVAMYRLATAETIGSSARKHRQYQVLFFFHIKRATPKL